MNQHTPTLVVTPSAMSHITLTPEYKAMACSMAAYCLQKSSNQLPVGKINIADSGRRQTLPIDWVLIPPSDMALTEGTYADKKEVVEYAAYGVTLAYLSTMHGIYHVARTASTGNGFDFYLNTHLAGASASAKNLDRLEVSGIFSDSPKLLGRLRAKLKQAIKKRIAPGTARASVVEFSEPKIAISLRTIK